MVLDGQVLGGWKRRLSGEQVRVEIGPLDALDTAATAVLHRAAGDFGRFLGRPVTVSGAPAQTA